MWAYAKKLGLPAAALLLLAGCGTTGAMSAAGDAVMRAGGLRVDAAPEVTPNANSDEPHWSETWVWEGDG